MTSPGTTTVMNLIPDNTTANVYDASYLQTGETNMNDSVPAFRRFSVEVSPVPSCITASIGILGNVLAIVVLFRSANAHKWKTFYRLVLALTITDLFGIVATTPVVLLVYANSIQFIGGQPVCDYLSFMMVFAGFATICIVTSMSFDRFLAVWFPYSYHTTVTRRRVAVTLLSIWSTAIVLGCLPIFGLGHNITQYPGTWCFFNFHSTLIMDSVFAILYASLGIGIISFTAIMNLLVSVKLKQQKRRYSCVIKISDGPYEKNRTRCLRNNITQMVFLISVTLVFAVCWLPLMIQVLIKQIQKSTGPDWVDLMAVRLAAINQILNPWIYIILRKEFLSDIWTVGLKSCRIPCARVPDNNNVGDIAVSVSSRKQTTCMFTDHTELAVLKT
ncbi:prostaglandin E2 receptor EP4 subtype-like [Mizuhopecten yessoensis]|uniref:Prostaglandin E2 receptor EP4 subtype n=1 Tax=Mizuhopecten yessoensis TaxID=6573 RepID=A0A210R617_MIZYE|nr:prostaglandin E2 receptor EP4 subtype-like [Mizuhopecten yessoensis]OWF56348.1 Prostaglandin E2 receptor EP4 subtype [Mizuhopecten yessoensis]